MNFLTNHFLIAMPQMTDPNFYHCVAYVCEHNESGALAIVINRPTPVMVSEILEQLNIVIENPQLTKLPVFYGGPLHQERGFVIHRPSGEWKSSFFPGEGIVVTTSRDILEALGTNQGPKDVIVSLGYAGWGSGQLEQEIANNTWLSIPADPNILFDTPYDKRWGEAARLLGFDINTLSGDTGHA